MTLQVQELKDETDKDAIPMSEEYKQAAEELITEKMERTFESGRSNMCNASASANIFLERELETLLLS